MLKPIPKKLLIHSVDYQAIAEGDGWGSGYEPAITIDKVRVQPTRTLNRDSNSVAEGVNHIVFIDTRHSTNVPENIKVGSKMTFDDNEYEIATVKNQYAFTLHHIELELR